jgi:hypothetical protein
MTSIFNRYPGAKRLTFDNVNDLWLFPGLGSYTIEDATDIINLRDSRPPEPKTGHLFDNYSAREDRFIDECGFSSGLD